jgi:hypothetical protein
MFWWWGRVDGPGLGALPVLGAANAFGIGGNCILRAVFVGKV